MELKRLKDEGETAGLEDYFQALFAMYPSLGWQKVTEDMGRLKQIYDRVDDVETVEELYFRKGQLNIISQVLTHQARSEAGYAAALEEQEGEAEAPTGGVAKVVK
jgi:hypothetical protein